MRNGRDLFLITIPVEPDWIVHVIGLPLSTRVGRMKRNPKLRLTLSNGKVIPLTSVGTVKGRLERLNLHNRNEFVIYPPVPGVQVTCLFPEELFSQVQAAIKQNITVSGRLVFRPGSAFPERVHVRRIEIHPAAEKLPQLA